MSALSELLTQANKEGLSVAAIAEKARERGHKIGHDTVWKYMTGRHGEVSEPYLRALADVLAVRYEKLRQAAGIPASLGDYVAPPEASALNRRERAALDVIIRSMARRKIDEGQRLAAGLTAVPDPDDYDVEAAHTSPEPAGLPEPESP